MPGLNPRGFGQGFRQGFGMMSDYQAQQEQQRLQRQQEQRQQEQFEQQAELREMKMDKLRQKRNQQLTQQGLQQLAQGQEPGEEALSAMGELGVDPQKFVSGEYTQAAQDLQEAMTESQLEGIQNTQDALTFEGGRGLAAGPMAQTASPQTQKRTYEALNDPRIIRAANGFLGDQVRRGVGETVETRDGSKRITDKQIAGFVPGPAGQVFPELQVTLSDGSTYRAPRTESRSEAEEAASSVGIDELMDQAAGLTRIDQAFQNDPQARQNAAAVLRSMDPEKYQRTIKTHKLGNKGTLVQVQDPIKGGSSTFLPNQPEAEPPQVETFYDEGTGERYKAQWNPQTGEWQRVGGTEAEEADGTTFTDTAGNLKGKTSSRIFRTVGEMMGGAYNPETGTLSGLSQNQRETQNRVAVLAENALMNGQARSVNQAVNRAWQEVEAEQPDALEQDKSEQVPVPEKVREDLLQQNARIRRLLPMMDKIEGDVPESTGLASNFQTFLDSTIGQMTNDEMYPETAEARQKINQFRQKIKMALVNSNRFPVYEQKQVERMLPTPEDVFANPQTALSKFRQLRSFLEDTKEKNQDLLEGKSPGRTREIQTPDEYHELPAGTEFRYNGKTYRKPKNGSDSGQFGRNN